MSGIFAPERIGRNEKFDTQTKKLHRFTSSVR
jgi:hypothetical protein